MQSRECKKDETTLLALESGAPQVPANKVAADSAVCTIWATTANCLPCLWLSPVAKKIAIHRCATNRSVLEGCTLTKHELRLQTSTCRPVVMSRSGMVLIVTSIDMIPYCKIFSRQLASAANRATVCATSRRTPISSCFVSSNKAYSEANTKRERTKGKGR